MEVRLQTVEMKAHGVPMGIATDLAMGIATSLAMGVVIGWDTGIPIGMALEDLRA